MRLSSYLILLSILLVSSEGFYTTRSKKLLNILKTTTILNVKLYCILWTNKGPTGESVELLINQNDNIEFPNEFSVKLSALSAVSVVFEKIQKGPSYPIGDGNVYTVDSDRKVQMTKMNNDQQVNIKKN